MSQKRSTGRQFTVDLFDDNSEDDFDNMDDVGNLTLAELFTQEEVRRAGRERRQHEERNRIDTRHTISKYKGLILEKRLMNNEYRPTFTVKIHSISAKTFEQQFRHISKLGFFNNVRGIISISYFLYN
jgi:hypothetical protein